MDKYVILGEVGQGTYGKVMKARCRASGKTVAIKQTNFSNPMEGIPSTTLREISLLKMLNKNSHIIKLFKVITDEKAIYLIFEYVKYDLKQYLKSFSPLDAERVQYFLYQMLDAINFCHARRIVHRDIKPDNILITQNNTLKLADFGLARTFSVPNRCYTSVVVTLWYRPPEILLNTDYYSTSVDIWSVGCIFSEMSNGKALFHGSCEIEHLLSIYNILGTPDERCWPGISELRNFSKDFPKWGSTNLTSLHGRMTHEGIDLLRKMLVYSPMDRISASEALNHVYFSDLYYSQYSNEIQQSMELEHQSQSEDDSLMVFE